MSFAEVAITFNAATSNNDTLSVAHVWDIRSGAAIASLKSCHASGVASSVLPVVNAGGRTCGILAVVSDRPTLHYWSWLKDQPHTRMTLPEKMGSLVITHSGLFCVGGGESGKLYVWEISTGRLLNVIDAHYRAIRIMKFSTDDHALITAGDDALCHSWSLSTLFSKSKKPIPDITLTSHTLPITDMYLSMSLLQSARAYTASIDRTVKTWQLYSKTLLFTILFPTPIVCIAVDPPETRLFAGGDLGVIYGTELFPKQGDGSRRTMRNKGIEDGGALTYSSHTGKITGLALSFDSTLLVSTSMDKTAIVWDVISRQALRTFSDHKVPLTGLHVIIRPPDLLDPKSTLKSSTVSTFRRHMTSDTDNQEVVAVPTHMDEEQSRKRKRSDFVDELPLSLRLAHDASGLDSTQSEVEQLRSEIARLKQVNKQLKTVNDELYQAAVGQFSKQS
ncbi:hypothetical protein SmJEL517_g05025 [Synchytrium microbalum]|uniref:Pre-rRNA-processing protein IPI3 n=1 Tax=Synchytrium microbalum TaxID=1806994 RepID=A0A507C2I5_9FUNG|nr:uncharacterized protein SmJEL517_g05025 [Synchytrium microbalum]TPX31745.1 hypothetical protein SmJEL517_g05025 [Synchytrium microbalum]